MIAPSLATKNAVPTERIPEVLAPAGDMDRLRCAFFYGADAVYIGGTAFGLRKHADNFSLDEIQAAVDYAHALSKRVYITCNAMPLQRDMSELPAFLRALNAIGPDALIISDPGVFQVARDTSQIPIHISTQASSINSWTASWWRKLGAKRVVLARECSVQDAARIRDNAEIEVETFVHGAMCASHSGKCVISNYSAGRDANRGGCVQSCRYPFGLDANEHENEVDAAIMNARDLQALRLIPECIRAGIDSVKIEGRMKSPAYVAMATRSYRQAIDACQRGPVSEAQWQTWEKDLACASHRGFSKGFLQAPAFAEAIAEDPGDYTRAAQFIGIVRARSAGDAIIEIRDGADIPCDVRFALPDGDWLPARWDSLRRLDGSPCTRLAPNTCVRVPCPEIVQAHCVVMGALKK